MMENLYLVIVNDKFLITMKAQSCGGAEHRVFEACNNVGVKSCLAYSLNDMGLDMFRAQVKNCSSISIEEFVEKTRILSHQREQLSKAKENMNTLENTLKEVQKLISDQSAESAEIFKTIISTKSDLGLI